MWCTFFRRLLPKYVISLKTTGELNLFNYKSLFAKFPNKL